MLEGSDSRRCVGGSWDGEDPICVGLSQHHDYSTEMPPTILFRHENGAIAQSNQGELVVVPGTILHMECLFKRKYGNPTWYIDNYSGRTYPQVLLNITVFCKGAKEQKHQRGSTSFAFQPKRALLFTIFQNPALFSLAFMSIIQ